MTILEFFASSRKAIYKDIEIEGREHINLALAKGQGVFVLCCHIGSWEAMGSYVNRSITPAYVTVKRVGSGSVDKFVSKLRDKNLFRIIKRQKKGDGYRNINLALDQNHIVGFVMDQKRPGEPYLPFFGQPAKTNTSLAKLWLSRKTPIVPGFIHRTGPFQHRMTFLPELELYASGNHDADIKQLSTLFNTVVEEMVRKDPTQYFWLHHRWK